MSEFWLISAPGEKTCKETWDRLNKATSSSNGLSTNHKFHIPELKVGIIIYVYLHQYIRKSVIIDQNYRLVI